MATRFSSNATVQVPRLLIALSIVVFITGAFSLTISGSGVSVVLPAAVVFGMGLYFNGARRYDVMDDKIHTVGNPWPAGFRVWEDKCLRGCTPRVFHLPSTVIPYGRAAVICHRGRSGSILLLATEISLGAGSCSFSRCGSRGIGCLEGRSSKHCTFLNRPVAQGRPQHQASRFDH